MSTSNQTLKKELNSFVFIDETENFERTPIRLANGVVLLGFNADFQRLLELINKQFPMMKIVKAKQSKARLWLLSDSELQSWQISQRER